MEPFTSTGNYYLINHLTMITGLSDRTIRNYIASGILKGEKINGIWHFSPEETDQFLRNPAVMPSIQAKQNSIVYDFLIDRKKQHEETCIILDLPGHNAKSAAEYFCYAISNSSCLNIRFSFDHTTGVPRVILRGIYQDIMKLTNEYYRSVSM